MEEEILPSTLCIPWERKAVTVDMMFDSSYCARGTSKGLIRNNPHILKLFRVKAFFEDMRLVSKVSVCNYTKKVAAKNFFHLPIVSFSNAGNRFASSSCVLKTRINDTFSSFRVKTFFCQYFLQ